MPVTQGVTTKVTFSWSLPDTFRTTNRYISLCKIRKYMKILNAVLSSYIGLVEISYKNQQKRLRLLAPGARVPPPARPCPSSPPLIDRSQRSQPDQPSNLKSRLFDQKGLGAPTGSLRRLLRGYRYIYVRGNNVILKNEHLEKKKKIDCII